MTNLRKQLNLTPSTTIEDVEKFYVDNHGLVEFNCESYYKNSIIIQMIFGSGYRFSELTKLHNSKIKLINNELVFNVNSYYGSITVDEIKSLTKLDDETLDEIKHYFRLCNKIKELQEKYKKENNTVQFPILINQRIKPLIKSDLDSKKITIGDFTIKRHTKRSDKSYYYSVTTVGEQNLRYFLDYAKLFEQKIVTIRKQSYKYKKFMVESVSNEMPADLIAYIYLLEKYYEL